MVCRDVVWQRRAFCAVLPILLAWIAAVAATGVSGHTCTARRSASRGSDQKSGGAASRAWNNIEKECREKLEANKTAAAMRCLKGHFHDARDPGKRDGDRLTTLRKLRHDAEMFTWLHDQGQVTQQVKKLWRGIYHSARPQHVDQPDKVFEVAFKEQNDDRKLWHNSNNKAVYIDPSGDEVPKKTVRAKAAAFRGLEESFRAVGRAVIDRLLTDKALRDLRRFLQASTFYFYPRPGHHLLALLEDGLASPLLAQLSDGLRGALPTVLGPHTLTGARAWKADNSPLFSDNVGLPDLAESSAGAAVSVLIWTVPSSALNGSAEATLILLNRTDPDAGTADSTGRGVESTSSSVAWGNGSKALPELEQAVRIKYSANRAVVWGQDLEASWTGRGWKSGFLKRGIHLLLNFGWASCEP